MMLSKNFTLEELTYSATAARKGIDNTPSEKEINALKRLCANVLQPIREEYGLPIVITSGYRCKTLNSLVGGAVSSQHRYGEAADMKVGNRTQNKALFDLIVKMIKAGKITVGQLINEYNYSWIHVSLPRLGKPNNQILSIG